MNNRLYTSVTSVLIFNFNTSHTFIGTTTLRDLYNVYLQNRLHRDCTKKCSNQRLLCVFILLIVIQPLRHDRYCQLSIVHLIVVTFAA